MISDDDLRRRLKSIGGPQDNPSRSTAPKGRRSWRRGTPEFFSMMDEIEEEWELDEEDLENIVEVRRADDSFEIRFKGCDSWELLEEDPEDSDVEDSVRDLERDSFEEE
jgi:hypothetical protein